MLRLHLCHLFIAATLSSQIFVTEFLFSFLKLFEIPEDALLLICKVLNVTSFLENEL